MRAGSRGAKDREPLRGTPTLETRAQRLLSPGLDIDGLYRISGNLATIQKLRYKVDHGEARARPRPSARGRGTKGCSPPLLSLRPARRR